jgi:hypothetical protein
MLDIKFKTDKAVKKLERLPQHLKKAVSSTSDKIKYDVYEATLPIAPRWNEVLRHSILSESYDFVETPYGLQQHLVYDAWNPKTGFHYAELRYHETTSGITAWATIGGEISRPLIEKEITQAVKKGVGN